MNLICEATSIVEAKRLIKYESVKTICVGLDFLSLDLKPIVLFELENLVKILKKKEIKIAVNATKLFHEDDLAYVKIILKNAIFNEVDYFIYSDMGFYQILVSLGFSEKTIYSSPTYLTNSADVNVFNKLNSQVVVSNQISKNELKVICDNAIKPVIVSGFGIATCFYSKRMLVTTYLKYKGKKSDLYRGKVLDLTEETRSEPYHLIEDENGVRIFDIKHYYLSDELDSLKNVSSLFIHHTMLSTRDYEEIVSLYNSLLLNKITPEEFDSSINKCNTLVYKGAYLKETILLKGDDKNE